MADAAYIHVPFCMSRCPYCDFSSQAGRSELIPAWFKAVKREISAAGKWASGQHGLKQPLKTVFFGGGTPSILDPAMIADLIACLKMEFGLADNHEITLEANPGTLSRAVANNLARSGVNRISLGLQAAQPRLLKALGRIHDSQDFINSVNWVADAGIRKISADIMLGLPGQTISDIDETIELLAGLPVGHVSYYSLIIEEFTPFFDIYGNHPELLPDEILERQIYHHTMERLVQIGMQPYEISNASLPGEQCMHNLVYWHADPYFGFGPAAHSYLAGVRRGNTNSLDKYLQVWDKTQDQESVSMTTPFIAAEEAVEIDETERMNETMLLGLRLLEGVNFKKFEIRHGSDPRTVYRDILTSLNKRGLIEIDDIGVRLTRIGLDMANQVFMEFV